MNRFFANCSVRFGIFLIFALVSLSSSAIRSARAADDADELSFCSFGPRVNVVHKKGSSESDECTGKVHVQGVVWKCGSSDDVTETVSKFLTRLNNSAREECRKYCEGLGSNCRGVYSPRSSCGLGTDRDDAIALGKKLGCRKDCTDGKAFTYCSLYNTGYQGPNPEAVLSQAPNCECRSSS